MEQIWSAVGLLSLGLAAVAVISRIAGRPARRWAVASAAAAGVAAVADGAWAGLAPGLHSLSMQALLAGGIAWLGVLFHLFWKKRLDRTLILVATGLFLLGGFSSSLLGDAQALARARKLVERREWAAALNVLEGVEPGSGAAPTARDLARLARTGAVIDRSRQAINRLADGDDVAWDREVSTVVYSRPEEYDRAAIGLVWLRAAQQEERLGHALTALEIHRALERIGGLEAIGASVGQTE